MSDLDILVLAAGKGTRMRSARPKVLHTLAGRPLLDHVLERARALAPRRLIVVHGHGGEALRAAFADAADLLWVEQNPPRGTGDAVRAALAAHPPAGGRVLVLYGDVPCLPPGDLERLLAEAEGERLALLTARLPDPRGYGRIVRDAAGRVRAIVEEADAGAEEKRIDEVNTGILCAPAAHLADWVRRLRADNAQGEYYLTDVVALAVADGVPVAAVPASDPEAVLGVNSRAQLAALEARLRRARAEALMAAGVTLRDPERVELRGRLEIEQDVEIDVGVVLEGHVKIGRDTRIGPYCVLRDVEIGRGVVIEAHSVLHGARIGDGCRVGPFARLRPDTVLDAGARIGNFVETKNARIGAGSKVNHLSYIGDATVGREVNVGAGTITCNYDGAAKHHTVIEDGAFIGSDSQLVAPVRIGRNATIGAGSTITRDAPPDALTLSRVRQTTVPGWRRPRKPDNKEDG